MIIIAIDPDTKRIGYSIWENEHLKSWGLIDRDEEFLDKMHKLSTTYDKDTRVLVIEGQWLHPRASKRNVLTFERLVEVRASITTIFECNGWIPIVVQPQTWQTNVLQCSSQTKRVDRKRYSMRLASELAGQEIDNHNIADAICLGYWATQNVYKE